MAKNQKKTKQAAPQQTPSGIPSTDFFFIQGFNALLEKSRIPGGITLFPSAAGIGENGLPRMTHHIHNVPFSLALNSAIAMLPVIVEAELRNHPEYKKEYISIFTDFLDKLMQVVKTTNEKVAQYNKKNPQISQPQSSK